MIIATAAIAATILTTIGLIAGLTAKRAWYRKVLTCMHHERDEESPVSWVETYFFDHGTRRILMCQKCRKAWPA